MKSRQNVNIGGQATRDFIARIYRDYQFFRAPLRRHIAWKYTLPGPHLNCIIHDAAIMPLPNTPVVKGDFGRHTLPFR